MKAHWVIIVGVGLACGLVRDTRADATGRSLPATAAVAAVVHMTEQLQFMPRRVIIHAGQTVEWRNASKFVHTVTADPTLATLSRSVELPAGAAPFHSPRLRPGDTYRHTFRVAGTYKYFCVPHEPAKMWGWVEVLGPSPHGAK